MVISDICIRRPVFATVLSLAVLLIGLVSYTRLAVREYPKIDEPVVTVESKYTGASAEIIESQVTKVLEDSLAGIEGISTLTSISRSEQSQITIKFRLERDADSAANDVRDRVARVRGRLPKDMDEPVVSKVEADANPIIWLAFSSDRLSPLEVTDYASRIVKTRLQTLPGAADVRVFGERRYAMRIWVDRDRLAAYRLTPADVEDALRKQNLEVPAGRIESREREFSVVAQTDLNEPSEFAAVVVKNVNGFPVRIGDVGRVEIAAQNERSVVRFNGKAAVALGVIKQSTANPLILSKAVRAELPRLVAELPPGMRVDIAYDSSVFIERSIDAVFTTILEAVGLVALVIFVSLRSLRATIIPLVTIPVSLIGAFTLMYLFNFSINTLTMLAFVLAIGLVVDDAIVMLENIYRHVENGMPRYQAALQGAKEIGFAVVAMTITLAAVYAPVAFMTGRTGKLFVEFALTLAGAVLVSGFVALTLSPMMCSVLLKHEPKHSWLYNQVERLLNGITDTYRRLLGAALSARWVVLLLGFAVAGASVYLFKQLKQELSPLEDRGVVIAVFIGPEGATIDYMQRYQQRAEAMFKGTKDVERYFVISGFPTVSQGISFVGLTDWEKRQRKSFDVARELQPKLFGGLPGVLGFPITPASLGQSPRDKPVQMVIISSLDREKLDEIVNRIMADAAKNPRLQALESDLKLNKPEVRVRVDRNKANDTSVQVDTVGRTLETMLGGRQVTRYKQNGEQYDVIVQVVPGDRNTPDDISNIFVRGRGDKMIPLEQLVSIKEGVSAREFNRFGQRVAVTISANLAPGYPLGEALGFLEETARAHLPVGTAIDYNGQSREFRESSAGLALTFLLALAFIYLVLAAQFESFVDPFTIMLSVPLSMTGALAALLLTGGTLNVYSQIGLVTLVGLITKHGILIVEFTNQLREQGNELHEALTEAAVLRLRPILMTTGAMVLGALPLALARGAGAESRSQIGWVIVGGMLLGTMLTLFVVPTVYSYLARSERTGVNKVMPQPVAGD
ncbi:MAG: efflux RND transporter permease subunit [Betaproteobacteria bacterium]|nr:MAG: efflux RND transporter permease subunit [Betaproteobacteria bacterium]